MDDNNLMSDPNWGEIKNRIISEIIKENPNYAAEDLDFEPSNDKVSILYKGDKIGSIKHRVAKKEEVPLLKNINPN
jgi:hypothetical protein